MYMQQRSGSFREEKWKFAGIICGGIAAGRKCNLPCNTGENEEERKKDERKLFETQSRSLASNSGTYWYLFIFLLCFWVEGCNY